MAYSILGGLSLALALLVTSPYWLRRINAWTFKTKSRRFLHLLQFLRTLHKPLGAALALIALIHGWLALSNRIRLHTGLLAYLGFLITAALGILHALLKNKTVFKAHKIAAFSSMLLLILHLVKPWALGEWFGLW